MGRENGSFRGVPISGSAGRLRCSPDVAMVEAPDFAKRHDPAGSWPFDRPLVGRVLVEREMLRRSPEGDHLGLAEATHPKNGWGDLD